MNHLCFPLTTEPLSFRANNKKFKLLPKSTFETSVVLKLNASKDYWFKVWANFNGSTSEPAKVDFDPYTEIGPPKLAVAGCGTCLWVNISLPEADRHSGAGDIQKYYGADFKIFWRKGHQGKVEVRGQANKNFPLDNLEKGVEYCVAAEISGIAIKKTIRSNWSCAFTSPEPSGFKRLSVVAPLVFLFTLSLIVSGLLLYTGFLCKLRVTKPSALMSPQTKEPILTPDETLLDPISITPGMSKQKEQLLRASLTSSEDEEDQDDEEEGGVQLYFDRNAELSSGEPSELKSCRGSGEGPVAAKEAFSSLKAPAEEDVHEDEEDDAEAVKEEGGIARNSSQSGVQAEEEEEVMPDISCNVDLFSLTLASLAAADEDEEEECGDFLDHLKQDDPQSPSEDQACVLLLQPAQAEQTEDSCAHIPLQSEEEEEEDFSGYLGHR
uniref:Interferon/interleukin receptor domain-containing protein n=1 Tax=Oryzias sinensis TaxID=183150 RepID=A0A8C8DGI7_9TELE